MSVFFAILLTVVAFAWVAYPLWRQRGQPVAEPGEDERLQELQSRRDTTYSMLKELQFDYQSGLLSADDYRDLETRYKRKAVSILKGLDRAEQGADVEDEIEAEVRRLRQVKAGPVPEKEKPKAVDTGDEIEAEIRKLRQQTARFCSQCGARARTGDRFCSSCGASLERGDGGD